jgi:phosphoglycerate dehydrogenase-like enzyme
LLLLVRTVDFGMLIVLAFCTPLCSRPSLFSSQNSAKDLPRLLRNKEATNWEKYPVLELRGATMGVVGYGDIGKAAARLAYAYGMKVQALKRRPASEKDPIVDVMYGNSKEELLKLFASCDYIICAMPLTPETRGMIGKAEFDAAKKGAVFVNVGRGPIVDEEALIAALKDGRLKGGGLDVFATEPLSAESPLWTMDNVLLSPHNMDMTTSFMHEATAFFLEENLPRFVRMETLLNPVDPAAGY